MSALARYTVLAFMLLGACSRAKERPAPATRRDAAASPPAGAAPAMDTTDTGGATSAGAAPRAIQLALGGAHTCALLSDGAVRCWGLGADGRLGTGSTASVGDDEPAGRAPAIELGGRATAIAAGEAHTCALLEGGRVRCWGRGQQGQLGYGRTDSVGDDEAPASAGDVPLGEPATAIAAGGDVTCALLASGAIRCWGDNSAGRLGYGGLQRGYLGDDEPVTSRDPIRLDRPVLQLACDWGTTCVLFEDGNVRCWGSVVGSIDPDSAPAVARHDVDVGAPVARLSFATIACVVTRGSRARCWGSSGVFDDDDSVGGIGAHRNAGQGFSAPADLGDLPIPGAIMSIAVGSQHGCVLLDGGTVRCWGARRFGLLRGPGGDSVSIEDATLVDVGAPVVALAASKFHSCVITDQGGVRCWGLGKDGRLGHGTIDNIGEQRPPGAAGDVPLAAGP